MSPHTPAVAPMLREMPMPPSMICPATITATETAMIEPLPHGVSEILFAHPLIFVGAGVGGLLVGFSVWLGFDAGAWLPSLVAVAVAVVGIIVPILTLRQTRKKEDAARLDEFYRRGIEDGKEARREELAHYKADLDVEKAENARLQQQLDALREKGRK